MSGIQLKLTSWGSWMMRRSKDRSNSSKLYPSNHDQTLMQKTTRTLSKEMKNKHILDHIIQLSFPFYLAQRHSYVQ